MNGYLEGEALELDRNVASLIVALGRMRGKQFDIIVKLNRLHQLGALQGREVISLTQALVGRRLLRTRDETHKRV